MYVRFNRPLPAMSVAIVISFLRRILLFVVGPIENFNAFIKPFFY